MWQNRESACVPLAGSIGTPPPVAESPSLKRRRAASPSSSPERAPPASGCLTKEQRGKIALADLVLEADRIVRECLSDADKKAQGGFRYVQPISELAKGIVGKRLPPGCPEMTRLAVVARNLDPCFTNPSSMRFTEQYKNYHWAALKQGSSALSSHNFRRGRQDPSVVYDLSDVTTSGVYQMFATGELLPSVSSLEEHMLKQVDPTNFPLCARL